MAVLRDGKDLIPYSLKQIASEGPVHVCVSIGWSDPSVYTFVLNTAQSGANLYLTARSRSRLGTLEIAQNVENYPLFVNEE